MADSKNRLFMFSEFSRQITPCEKYRFCFLVFRTIRVNVAQLKV